MTSIVLSWITSPSTPGLLYLDPGTGSFLLQILIAAGMSVLFVIGVFRKKLSAFFSRLLGRRSSGPAPEDTPSDDD
jgi:hypothetical protein